MTRRGLIVLVGMAAAVAGCVTVNEQTVAAIDSGLLCEMLGPAWVSTPSERRTMVAELERRGERCSADFRTAKRRDGPAQTASTGTAFRVGPSTLLTSAHVVEGAREIEIRCPGAPQSTATVHRRSAAADLAILSTPSVADRWLPLASTDGVSLGDDVFVVGYPVAGVLGEEPRYTSGSVSSLSGLRGDSSFLQISAPIQPGNSGSAVISPDRGVIGVVASTAAVEAFYEYTGSLPQNLNFAVKTDLLPALDRTLALRPGKVTIQEAVHATCAVTAKP